MENIEVMNEKWYKSKTQNIASIIILLGYFSLLGLLFFVEIPEKNRDILNYTIAGFTGVVLQGVMLYLFNFKKKEEEKTTISSNESL